MTNPLDRLRHHVTGAIERGEKTAIEAQDTFTITAPATLNGCPVIRSESHAVCATIMAKRAPGDYVVATWWPELGDSWSWGHYSRDTETAARDFSAAVERNAMRTNQG